MTEHVVHTFDYANAFVDRVYESKADTRLTMMLRQDFKSMLERLPKYNDNLAGDIQEQYLLANAQTGTVNIKQKMLEDIISMLTQHTTNIIGDSLDTINLHDLWINVQKPYEYNPVHNHGGDFSFIWYLDVPEEIREEYLQSSGVSKVRGLVQFISALTNDILLFNPEKEDLYIFRAQQLHQVYPFHSDVKRVSVSGNFSLSFKGQDNGK